MTLSPAVVVSRLAHDVGKYVARTALNLPDGPVPEALLGMLLKDLYETDGKDRASRVFAAGSRQLPPSYRDPRLDACREGLARIDAMEAQVRAGDQTSLVEVVRIARHVHGMLTSLAREAREAHG